MHVLKGCEALALLVETDDFGAHTAQYIHVGSSSGGAGAGAGADEVARLARLQRLVERDFQRDAAQRALLWPLCDVIAHAKRQAAHAARK